MSASPKAAPKYRHYKPKNLGVVRIDGRDHYLGKFGSPESYEKYHRLLAERFAHGTLASAVGRETEPQAEPLTITQLCARYYRHCETYYTKNGVATNQARMIRISLKVLRRLYGSTLAKDFGPLSLKACQVEFVGDGLSRREVNRRVSLIKQAFQWGTANELLPGNVYHALQAVKGLKRGRCQAPDPAPVGPVPEAIVERTIEHLSPTVAAMVRLQLASAMRPGELVVMRARDLNMFGAIWEYRPGEHKGEHLEKDRVIMLGPRAIEIIRPFLCLDISGFTFSPKRVVAQKEAERRESRKSPLWASHAEQQARKRAARGRRSLKDRYDVSAYRRAIARACDKAFLHPELSKVEKKKLTPEQWDELKAWQKAHRWHPHQLRHTAATKIRRQYGAEAAQAVLGHAELSTTEIYAEKSLEAARQIAREIG
jgi:integrase